MRQELDDLLCQRYPEIFRDRNGNSDETSMTRGFCCGDGWFDIIDSLCAEITLQVEAGKMPPVVATQVKEKFWTLRIRIRGGNDETRRLVRHASRRSESTCEACGQPINPEIHPGMHYLFPDNENEPHEPA